MMLLSYTIIDFHLFYDDAIDIQIWAPLTRSQYELLVLIHHSDICIKVKKAKHAYRNEIKETPLYQICSGI